jgi:D-alanine-D-alanine ligase
MKITVLMGGTSSERDVSLASGMRVAEALRSRGHQVKAVDTVSGALSTGEEQKLLASGVKTAPPSQQELDRMSRESLPRTVKSLPSSHDTDVIFLGLHGGQGEDGTMQALLDLTGVPYTGSGHLASALAMDKDLSKHLFRATKVPTADWIMVREKDATGRAIAREQWPSASEVRSALGLPVIVKPSKQGSTVGLTVVKTEDELEPAVAEAFQFDDEVMIERFIAGREFTVGILGGDALPVGEIIPKHEIYDYECKYTAGMAEEVFPARISEEQTSRVQEYAKRAFAALKLRGCARIDFRLSEDDGEFYCLEANTLPGMTQLSLIPQAAAAAGISFPELCERIVRLALAGREGGGGEWHK